MWVFFGITAAITFTLLGWHNWHILSPSPSATLLIVLNLLTIITTILILHLGFFGRLIALYTRNFHRVAHITRLLHSQHAHAQGSTTHELDVWWNARSFVLNDDLSLDYDIGGLAVSLTFVLNVIVGIVLATVLYDQGYAGMLEPPGSYCAYSCMYITSCLIRIFQLATSTYTEQQTHLSLLQQMSVRLMMAGSEVGGYGAGNLNGGGLGSTPPPLPDIFTYSENILSFRTEDLWPQGAD
ncbi:hypothetical protein EON64_10630, partial [archaeon]